MVHMLEFNKNLKIAKFFLDGIGGHCATNRKVAGSIIHGDLTF